MHRSARMSTILPGLELVSIRSDRTFARHSHDEFGIGLLVDGRQESWSGRGLVEAQAGDVITVNPGELHDGICHSGNPRYWRMLYLSPVALARILGFPTDAFELERPVLRARDARIAVGAALATITSECPDPGRVEEALLTTIHDVCGRGMPSPDTRSVTPSTPVSRVRERIEAEARTPLSLDDHAATAGLSRWQILRLFAREIGTTPHGYLVQHRVKLARRANAGGSSLADAAAASGFADQSHMTRAFARQFGLTPGRYRAGRTDRDCNILQGSGANHR